MKILLVDDDNYILESIKSIINWEKIGIEEIYFADCVQQAKEIVEKIEVQIILCDIEMNDATGLDFIEWVRKGGGKEVVIFLTSYAEFDYAKKAVYLNSMDYLLKPIEFPVLEERLYKAVQKAKEQEQTQAYTVKHNLWMKSEPMRKEMFFRAIFEADNMDETDKIDVYKEKCGMEYDRESKFVYLCIEIFDYLTIYEKVEGGMFCFLISNITGELFSREGFLLETIFRSDTEDASQWNVILRIEHSYNQDNMRKVMESVCHNYIGQIEKTMQSKVGCYVGNIAPLGELKQEMEKVRKMQADDVTGINKVRFLKDYREKEIPYVEPSFIKWEEDLINYETDTVIREVEKYLNELVLQNKLNSKNLEMFLFDFTQMISVILRSKKVSINWLYQKVGYNGYYDTLKSIDNMKKYVREMISSTMEYLKFVQEEQSVTEIIKKHMKEHIQEELTRETFAELVYLNPDYLAKLFKKEEGLSMGQYLNDIRMDKAKILLSTTQFPINQIAVEVGYINFSYFAKMFRNKYGKTPNEYRRQICKPRSFL